MSTDTNLVLTSEQRDALTKELFARWGPVGHHCFRGSDADLVRAVQHACSRARDDRERGER